MCAQHVERNGKDLSKAICARDLEGIVAKRKPGIYKDHGTGWIKIKNQDYSQAKGRHELLTGNLRFGPRNSSNLSSKKRPGITDGQDNGRTFV